VPLIRPEDVKRVHRSHIFQHRARPRREATWFHNAIMEDQVRP
jgi:hypothetical protein